MWLYVAIHVYMYTCIHVYRYTCMATQMNMPHMYMYTCMDIHVYTYICGMFICVAWFIVRDMTPSYNVTWLMHMRHGSLYMFCVSTCFIVTCVACHICTCVVDMWHVHIGDLFIRDMTHSCYVICLVHMMWHNSFICGMAYICAP